jgi:hypothetical protein
MVRPLLRFIIKLKNKLEIMEEDIYYFDDWVSDMLNSSDYEEKDLLEFEEYYQNILSFNENTDMFINQLKIN